MTSSVCWLDDSNFTFIRSDSVRAWQSSEVYWSNTADKSEESPLLSEEMAEENTNKLGFSTDVLVKEDRQQKAKQLPQYAAALSATLGAFALGTVLSWTSPTTALLVVLDPATNASVNGESGFPVTTGQMSWIGAAMTLGAAVVVIPIGWLIDRIGRKNSMLLLVPPFTLGWALITWAQNVDMYYAGRFITGMAGGAFSLTAPVYTSEIAEDSIRGTLGSYFQLMVTIGILFVYVVGAFVSVWWLSLICMLVPLIFGAIFFIMPETPLYHLQNGKRSEALKSLQYFRGKKHDVEPELQKMVQEVEQAAQNKLSFKDAFRSKAAKKGLLIAFGLMVFQQLSGVNAVIFYTADIFQAAGSDIEPNYAAIIVGVMQVIATFVSTLIVDRLGRRVLLLLSDSVMAICTTIIGVFFYLMSTGQDVKSIGWLPLLATCVFIVVFSLGFGPIPWMMMGEIFSPQIKGFASSLACLLNWLLAFIVTKFFSDLVDAFGRHTTFWIFSVISALGTVFVFFFIPETKGKSSAEIQRELGGGEAAITTKDEEQKY